MRIVILPLLAGLLTSSALCAPPPAMTDLPYAQAIKQNAEQDDKLLIVKFTADWCVPCKRMDRTVWSDAKVIEYLQEHGITVIAVDIDAQPDIATEHKVTSIPTMVAFRDGDRADQIVGAVNSPELLAWVGHVLDGRTHAEILQRQINDRSDMSMRQRLDLAKELVDAGKLDEAIEEYTWLWEHMLEHETSLYGVRISFMINDMKNLAQRHKPALETFTGLRDALTEEMKNGDRSRENQIDWLVLNIRLLKDDQTVAEWVDHIQDRDDGIDTMREMGSLMQDWLLDHKRWAMAGQVLRSAETINSRARQFRSMLADEQRYDGMDKNIAARLKARSDQREIEKFARIHAAYLAADRQDDAWLIYDAMLEDFDPDSVRVAMCRAAADADVVTPRHKEIAGSLDEWTHRATRRAVLGE